MVNNLPNLNGSPIDWSRYSVQRIESIVLWVLVSALVLLAVKIFTREKVVKAAGFVSGGFFLMLLITIITVGLLENGLERKFKMTNTMNHALEMSTKQNFVMILLDGVNGRDMTKALEKHPEYKEAFSDFTYYSNTMGSYPSTLYVVPFLFLGERFENQEVYIEYGKRVYRTSPFFEEMEARGYRLGLYEPGAFLLEDCMFRFENIVSSFGKVSSITDFIKFELRLVGFKYMPLDLKQFCGTLPGESDKFREFESSENIIPCLLDNRDFYLYLKDNEIELTKDKCFRYFYLEGAHAPWHHDAELNIIENGTYEQSLEASMTVMMEYLQMLKDSGVYDNSSIMILSDHGWNLEDSESNLGRQNPILFVKGVGEKNDALQISEAPISQDDYQEAYVRLLDGKASDELFDYKEGDSRERRYLYYDMDEILHFYEYMQTGHASDESTMIPTGVEITP